MTNRARVLSACAKLTKTLSANKQAQATLDCLLDEGSRDAHFTLVRGWTCLRECIATNNTAHRRRSSWASETSLPVPPPPITHIQTRLTRTEAESAWAPHITRLRALCERAVHRARTAAAAAVASNVEQGGGEEAGLEEGAGDGGVRVCLSERAEREKKGGEEYVCVCDRLCFLVLPPKHPQQTIELNQTLHSTFQAPRTLMVDYVELVGGGSHIPCLVAAVEEGMRPFVVQAETAVTSAAGYVRTYVYTHKADAKLPFILQSHTQQQEQQLHPKNAECCGGGGPWLRADGGVAL